jgi:predicted nicotinamide N-methyase
MSRLCAAGDEDDENDENDNKPTTTSLTALAAARRDALAAAGRAMAALSGPMACGGRVVSFSTDALRLPPQGEPLRVREGAISDGLGARVWALAHLALRELCADPSLVKDKTVLEIGAGTGLLGVAAARLGAQRVVVSDNEPAVLRILRACAHLNAKAVEGARRGEGADGGAGDKPDDDDENGLPSVHSSEAETVDGEGSDDDDDDEDGDDDEEDNKAAATAPASAPTLASWDVAGGSLLVRAFDWADSLAALDGEEAAAPLRLLPAKADDAAATTEDFPPLLPQNETFEVVLGSEVMYEPEHARLVAAALAHRLSPPDSNNGGGGIALLACAGRFQGVFETFAQNCAQRGLRYRAVPVRPTAADYSDGILARHRAAAVVAGAGGGGSVGDGDGGKTGGDASAASAASSRVEYEGGFLLMAIDWAADEAAGVGAPAPSRWHRDDFVDGLVDGSAAPIETV